MYLKLNVQAHVYSICMLRIRRVYQTMLRSCGYKLQSVFVVIYLNNFQIIIPDIYTIIQ